ACQHDKSVRCTAAEILTEHNPGLGPWICILKSGKPRDQFSVPTPGLINEMELVVVHPNVAAGSFHREYVAARHRAPKDSGRPHIRILPRCRHSYDRCRVD